MIKEVDKKHETTFDAMGREVAPSIAEDEEDVERLLELDDDEEEDRS